MGLAVGKSGYATGDRRARVSAKCVGQKAGAEWQLVWA